MGKKRIAYDDNRVIADMNVEGMPWYVPKSDLPQGEKPDLGPGGTWALIWGVLKAVLLVFAVFTVGCLLFLLFCDVLWLA